VLGAPELSDRLQQELAWHIAPGMSVLALLESGDPRLASAARRRATMLEALELLLEASKDPAFIASALEHTWGPLELAPIPDPALAIAALHARLLREAFRPVRDAIPAIAAQRLASAWLPVLRAEDLGASAAALWLLERPVPSGLGDIETTLASAGYSDDEVYRALAENGVRHLRSLALLRDHGWSLGRLVATLIRRGTMVADVREHLVELGVPHRAIADALAAHVAPDLIAMLLDPDRS
jgi:hypothetical protein